MTLTLKEDRSAAPLCLNMKWRWLWDHCKFDPIQLAQLTGLKEAVLFGLDAAIGNRLIYPDGTISKTIDDKIRLPFMSEKDILEEGLIEKG